MGSVRASWVRGFDAGGKRHERRSDEKTKRREAEATRRRSGFERTQWPGGEAPPLPSCGQLKAARSMRFVSSHAELGKDEADAVGRFFDLFAKRAAARVAGFRAVQQE